VVWKLKEESEQTITERVLNEGPWHEGGDTNNVWIEMTTFIKKVASEEVRVTNGGKSKA
jgi:hypothetical protein